MTNVDKRHCIICKKELSVTKHGLLCKRCQIKGKENVTKIGTPIAGLLGTAVTIVKIVKNS